MLMYPSPLVSIYPLNPASGYIVVPI